MPNRQQVIQEYRFSLFISFCFHAPFLTMTDLHWGGRGILPAHKQDVLTFRIHIHLTLVASKLQAELPAITQTKEERFLPCRLAPTSLHTISQRITQTMTALHQQNIILPLCLIAKLESVVCLRHAMCLIESAGTLIGDIVEIAVPSIFWLPCLHRRWCATRSLSM